MATTATPTNGAASSTDGQSVASQDGGGGGGAEDVLLRLFGTLDDAGLPYLVGGPHASVHYTSSSDQAPLGAVGTPEVYVRPADQRKALNALVHAGFRTEYVAPHSRARASHAIAPAAEAEAEDPDSHPGAASVDVVYGSDNGLCDVDDDWFRFAVSADVAGHRVRMCPAEELLWHEAFLQERARHRGAEVARLILRQGRTFDWQRLLRRFHGHERVLLAHCVLFGYVYPTEQSCVPDWVLDYLHAAVRHEAQPHVKLCRGTLIAPGDYRGEVDSREFADGRLKPHGPLTAAELESIASSSPAAVEPASNAAAGSASTAASSDGVREKVE